MKPIYGFAGRVADTFINSKLTPLIIITALALGVMATIVLPREEDPEIHVPMIDVMVQAPGMSPQEVEERVSWPMEKPAEAADKEGHYGGRAELGARLKMVRAGTRPLPRRGAAGSGQRSMASTVSWYLPPNAFLAVGNPRRPDPCDCS
jgi:hypothetical protein